MKNFYVHQRSASDEDADPFCNEHMVLICDGLGGTGLSKHCPNPIDDQVRTSAYIGSRRVSALTIEYFNMHFNEAWSCDLNLLISDYKDFLCEKLAKDVEDYHLEKSLQGSSIALMPTTLALALFRVIEHKIEIITIWAGDSRVYLLSANKGLQQLSCDDVDGTYDAMGSLGTSNMSNSVSADGKDTFYINYKKHSITEQQYPILFATSDGSFDYLSTPMEYEYLLDSSILNCAESDSIEVLGEAIARNYVGAALKDDTTVAGVVFDAENMCELKKAYYPRWQFITENYHIPTEESSRQCVSAQSFVNQNLSKVNIALKHLKKDIIPYINETLKHSNEDESKQQLLSLECMRNIGEEKNLQQEVQVKEQQIKALMDERRKLIPILIKTFLSDYGKIKYNKKLEKKKYDEPNNNWIYEGKKILFNAIREEKEPEYKSKSDLLKSKQDLIDVMDKDPNFSLETTEAVLDWTLIQIMEKSQFLLDAVTYYNNCQYSEAEEEKIKRIVALEISEMNENIDKADLKQRAFSRKGKIGYDATSKVCVQIEEIERKRADQEKQIKTIKAKHDYTQYIKELGNKLIYEMIEIPEIENIFSRELRQKFIDFKTLNQQQEKQKMILRQSQGALEQLWNGYKDTYQLYERSCDGGKV